MKGHQYPTYPIEQNWTKNQSNPIELQSFDWVGQSNKIEQNRTKSNYQLAIFLLDRRKAFQ